MCVYSIVCDYKISKYICMCLGRIRETWYLRVDITGGQLPLVEHALALGVGLLESLLVACGVWAQSGRKVGQWGTMRGSRKGEEK